MLCSCVKPKVPVIVRLTAGQRNRNILKFGRLVTTTSEAIVTYLINRKFKFGKREKLTDGTVKDPSRLRVWSVGRLVILMALFPYLLNVKVTNGLS